MILGIDYGVKRIGLATADEEIRLALPYKSLLNNKDFFVFLDKICKEEKIKKIIVGIPFPLRGKKGSQIERVEKFIKTLKSEIKIPIYTTDEKLTTREVENYFVDFKKEMKKIDKDASAASIILQNYLDKTKI